MTGNSFELKDLRFRENKYERPEEIQRRSDFLLTLGFSNDDVDKIKAHNPLLDVANEAEHRMKALRSLGFSDPVKLISKKPNILDYNGADFEEKVSDLMAHLKRLGFHDPKEILTLQPSVIGFTFENIDAKINGLQKRGFSDSVKLISTVPALLALSFENIDAKIQGLKERGFQDPIGLLVSAPDIFSFSFENLDIKLKRLHDLGFNAIALISRWPRLLCLNIETINEKFQGLEGRGFDALKIISAQPSVMGYSFAKIDRKIGELQSIGIDPKKVLNLAPVVFGYEFENVKRKVVFINRVGRLIGFEGAGIDLAEYYPMFLGFKFEKIVVSLRILREYSDALASLNLSMVQKILSNNIEDVLVAFSQKESGETYSDLLKRIRYVKKQKMSREEKQKVILAELVELRKITDRYKDAYVKEGKAAKGDEETSMSGSI